MEEKWEYKEVQYFVKIKPQKKINKELKEGWVLEYFNEDKENSYTHFIFKRKIQKQIMCQYEYVEDKFNLNEPHIPASKIIQMREQAGWINVSTGVKGDTAILRFKRKIQQG